VAGWHPFAQRWLPEVFPLRRADEPKQAVGFVVETGSECVKQRVLAFSPCLP